MKTFVVSLKRSNERRQKVLEILAGLSIKFEFYDAVDASDKSFDYVKKANPELTKKRFGYHLIDNELACFASHFELWKKCVELDEPIWILEDNITTTPTLLKYLGKLSELTEKYQLLKLSSRRNKQHTIIEKIDSTTNIVRYKKYGYGTQSYTITPQAAQKLINGAGQFIEPVDNYMEKTWKHGVSTYCFLPNIIDRANVKSTIGSARKNKSGLKTHKKIYIELYRLYEQIRWKLYRHQY